MSVVEFGFHTDGEARAFVRGVEYVNDSAIEVLETTSSNGEHVVRLRDKDAPATTAPSEPPPAYKPPANARIVPSDEACSAAWNEIMAIASTHCLIVQAYGGVATLAVPGDQRKAGCRDAVLEAHCAQERPS